MKNERIIHVTLDETLKNSGRADWTKFDSTTEAEINKQVSGDADLQGLDAVDWSSAMAIDAPTKQPISIRLDQDVLDFFKAQGSGYQGRINRVLRHYVESARRSGT
jgi:uncharacterized protein (DUF4415 family)